jgi:hypothetical protein
MAHLPEEFSHRGIGFRVLLHIRLQRFQPDDDLALPFQVRVSRGDHQPLALDLRPLRGLIAVPEQRPILQERAQQF